MTKRMLIDATHDEETRVAVIDGNRLEEFDYESKFRKPLKGSIFLAKVTRVEPSLQAAFVNFGGNRHGFLPFSEIHPDYFRIPIADREALMAEQEAMLAEAEARQEEQQNAEEAAAEEAGQQEEGKNKESSVEDGVEIMDSVGHEEIDDEAGELASETDEEAGSEASAESATEDEESDEDENADNRGRGRGRGGRGGRGRGKGGRRMPYRNRTDETFEDENDVERRFRFSLRRKYKIQEVVNRGQIMLVQVSKEERGNKGAAVSTYLSLPGRYCVLMPNSPRAGGVSRKIANYKDRAKMRDMLKSFEIPKGMSVIVRTAGVERTKTEIKRDLDYLMRLWDNIRELTLQSSAPALVYEEADLIKRAVRDVYNKDIEDIQVAGEEGFKTAKAFMKLMMPSHVKKVVQYNDPQGVPLFHKHKIENQISEIGETTVTLKSGGYLVFNPTEALVSVDVNSGRATKERHIEETALKTNLEAADEVARQLRLRDLAGLVVIDFIDMEDRRNNGKVERRMREALSGDRARIQMGRISSFGLMELSRQRLNPSLTEAQFEKCPHCAGVGMVRTADAAAIIVLRTIEDEAMKAVRGAQFIVSVPTSVALFMLNNKRKHLTDIEERYNLSVSLRVDDTLGASGFNIEVVQPPREGDEADEDIEEGENKREEREDRDNEGRGRRSRRGGRGRNRRDRDNRSSEEHSEAGDSEGAPQAEQQEESAPAEQKPEEDKEKTEKPKRGRRSSKAKSGKTEEVKEQAESSDSEEKTAEEKPKAKRGRKKAEKPAEDKKAKKKPESSKETSKPENKIEPGEPSNDTPAAPEEKASSQYEVVNEPPKKKKRGWWNRGA